MMFNSILSVFLLFAPDLVNSLRFNLSDFKPGDPDIDYQGDAIQKGFVEFNNVRFAFRVGRAIYARRVPIRDHRTGKAADFNTNFSFMIDTLNSTQYGEGFAFFLAEFGVQAPINSVGGFLGLFNSSYSNSSAFPLVHIEFDTSKNPEWDPPKVDNHVGINVKSLASSNYTSWNASSHTQDIGHAHIAYDSATKNLSVSWTYELTSDPREVSSLFYIIDLAKVLPPQVMVGFSAATGSFLEGHRLLSWEFSSSLDIEATRENPSKTGKIVGVSLSAFVLLTVGILVTKVCLRRNQRKKETGETTVSRSFINENLERETGPRRFSYKDLVLATNNFSDERKLGQGGFGAVYKGWLKDMETMVAVKKLSRGSKQGKKEFITEVKIISSLRHQNLVQLIGWCHEKNDLLLIYEFMPNGSLDSHLFGQRNHLTWATRYKISLGLASALLYLHEELEQCVVHRDIKASNVMLDSDFGVKLGDFGLARLMDHGFSLQATGLAGTLGYMAPEYLRTWRASKKTDVYSFGIVLLEIVTGIKLIDRRQGRIEPEKSLVERVWDLYGRRELVLIVDEKLRGEFDREQAECLMVVGLWCAHPDRNSRPSIEQAIHVLNFKTPLPNLPHKMPVATYNVLPSNNPVSSRGATMTFSSGQIGR